VSHIYDSSVRPLTLHLSVTTLGTVMSALADAGLNLVDKG